MNISLIATYANYTHCSRVNCCRDGQMLKMISFIYFQRQIVSSQPREKISPASLQKLFLPVRKIFRFSQCGNAIFVFKTSHLFVSLSREFSRYMKTFAAGFILVQTVLYDVSIAGVQSETMWFQIENASGRNVSVRKKFSKVSQKSFTSEQVIASYPREILSQPL